jgi:type II secretory pathway pseudopilin PulG
MTRHRRDSGFSLAALIFFAAAASILAAAAVPAYQMQAKREREKELIFRGEEYTRAIQKYQRKFGVYPASIDQLVQTNGIRFLRHQYKDPITGKDFRLLRINPDGSLSGSKIFQRNVTGAQSLFGNTQPFGQQQSGTGTQQQPGTIGQPPQQQQQPLQQQQTLQPQQPSQQPLQQPGQQPAQQPGQTNGFSSGFTPIGGAAAGTPGASGGVIGVASDSDEASVMVYNQRQKYSEWEFVAILGQNGQQGQRGQPPVQGQPPGGTQPVNPFSGGTRGSPFGPQPGTNPFGPAPGQQQQPNSGTPGKLP